MNRKQEKIFLLAIITSIIGFLDVLTTDYNLKVVGKQEINPIANYTLKLFGLNDGLQFLLIFKLSLILLITGLSISQNSIKPLIIFTSINLIIVVNNLIPIISYHL